MKTLLTTVAMTFVFGFLSTAAAFYIVGGPLALRGPYVVVRDWPWIYALVVVSAAAIGLGLGSLTRSWPRRQVTVVIVGGWLGEYVVLATVGLISISELNPPTALAYWVLATAGPAQPVAAWLGAQIGRRGRLSRLRNSRGLGSGVGDPPSAKAVREAAE